MPDLTYDVIALQFPIVYGLDGDHDPDGLLYTLRAYEPLLRFARARWEDDDRFLPRMHERAQWMQLVVDGLARFEEMSRRPAPVTQAQRQNFGDTVEELTAALKLLTDGAVTTIDPDPVVRASWADLYRAALAQVRTAVAERLAKLEVDDHLAFHRLARESGLSVTRVRRLLLNDHRESVAGLAERTPAYDRFNPLRPIPVVRPLVLRAALGQRVDVRFENQVRDRTVGLHVQGDLTGSVQEDDGAAVGRNTPSTVRPGERRTYHWHAAREGVWVVNDLGDVRGTEKGTNVHGLFGAFIVEPPGATWTDPETGELLTGTIFGDGPDVDVILPGDTVTDDYVDLHLDGLPHSHREFTVFLHDEPEVHSGQHLVGEHSVMPLSYRAEPMPNRLPHRMRRLAEETLTRPLPPEGEVDFAAVGIELDEDLAEVFRIGRTSDGRFLERVAGEEQHHSSWLFGDPVTPIFRAYKGDPARVRLLHAGVKETHVFHLHVHQWRATPGDSAEPGQARGSQLLDSISIGPQTTFTIDPLYGSGSRQHAPGDIIWHCHLYPHFHHGMWGLWRSFDRLVDGVTVTAYPDGTPVHPLRPLPGRRPEPTDEAHPGFPWFIDATFPRKSPPPPAVVDEFLGGRRRLLGMPLHSDKELAAFAPGAVANPQPGMLFVDLDGDQARWNERAGLPAPRIVSYDVEVSASEVVYNNAGWKDPTGHHYRITRVAVDGVEVEDRPERPIEPFFPRANQGDIVELRMFNALTELPPDGFDLRTPPVECGLHVHLVKFDVLAADGSSTGWNYLAGASCDEAVAEVPEDPRFLPRVVGLHRWVVDEEFGPCFFHDHLLANYRQKHGLFAALIAEPHGSRWLTPDQETVAWSGPQAVILPPVGSGIPPFREACLAIGDFVPLTDAAGKPLNPPGELSGDDDPGSMAVNYRSAPLTFRGDDPSQWFASNGVPAVEEPEEPEEEDEEALAVRQALAGAPAARPDDSGAHAEAVPAVKDVDTPVKEVPADPEPPLDETGDPETELIRTYAGEPMRIRLIQGSHEESHSFATNGLRWRREWHDPRSTLVNQQTIGISEAFTLDLDEYGTGDHLWQFANLDDLWLGCWGLVRALVPHEDTLRELPRLPGPARASTLPPRPLHGTGVREYVVRARRHEHEYDGRRLTDPWGLIFEEADGFVTGEDGFRTAVGVRETREPLVLRARRGEWVKVTLINEIELDGGPLLPDFNVEPSPPRVPLDEDQRTVTPRVSLHPALLRYDVVSDDGANVGRNHDGTVAARPPEEHTHTPADPEATGVVVLRDGARHDHAETNWREYWWFADDQLAPESYTEGPGQVCHLKDMADVRNHPHHGLIGALVVEPGDVTPTDPRTGVERWTGGNVWLRDEAGRVVANEQVLLVQDGMRHFVAGNPDLPVRDVVPDDDPEDSGQKGVSYGSALAHPRDVLTRDDPPTPIWHAEVGQTLWLRLLGSGDKPRAHTFTVHGMAWESAPWLPVSPFEGSVAGLTSGYARTLVMRARHAGDHAYRSGAFRWAVENGVWGIIRVE
ncbi:multicopper oxidase domain-containing protein [Symbioplanes lichenis]|uniref:multicopper oxidase domain-containing protein n=1 Tax=Symbioplanes lichenis TaxID=1629072 RepID=UPI002738EEF7|nr:multicopper oxidase domain-containing protein [Actinoplanes lichenis]